jgi:Domain of unknown function (DUF1707)
MCWSSHHHYRSEDQDFERRRSTLRPGNDPVSAAADLRVSDVERNRVVEVLKLHTADGRLTLDEFETRVEETLSARTGTDLRAVLRELPSVETEPSRRRRVAPGPLTRLPVVAMVVVLVWLAIGHVPLWPLVIVAVFCFRACAHRQPTAPRDHGSLDRTDSEDITFV